MALIGIVIPTALKNIRSNESVCYKSEIPMIYKEDYIFSLSFNDPFRINIELQLSIFNLGIKLTLCLPIYKSKSFTEYQNSKYNN